MADSRAPFLIRRTGLETPSRTLALRPTTFDTREAISWRRNGVIKARSCGFPAICKGLFAAFLVVCSAAAVPAATAQKSVARTGAQAGSKTHARPAAKKRAAATSKSATAEAKQLETLAHRMRDDDKLVAARAFNRLVALQRHWSGVERDRAALAIGYYDFSRAHYADARIWFHRARRDPVLSRYALYWEGVNAGKAGQDADALKLLGEFLHRYPYSVMRKAAVGAFADAALDAKQPKRAIAALRAYPGTFDSAAMLLRLGLAREQEKKFSDAAIDFQRVYNRFPLKPQADDAKKGIARVRARLGRKFPEAPIADRLYRAETLFRHRQWRDARAAWRGLRRSLAGVARERADLRAAECYARLHRNARVLKALKLSDRRLDAERWLAVFRAYRSRNDEDGMKAAVEKVLGLAGHGAPAGMGDEALYLMGNYYWANVKRDQAVPYYQQVLDRHARGEKAVNANWRIAWTAYLENKPNATVLLRSHIERYPDSPYVPDALYWLGRLAERAEDLAVARAYYGKLSSRFVETYFGRLARERLRQIQAKESAASIQPVLERIPPIPRASELIDDVPASVHGRYRRAQALRSIAFDDSAMLEFRAAYRIAKAPQLLIDAARAAQAADHYLTGAALVRLLVPDLESRPIDAVPIDIWRIVYPLPYRPLISRYAGHYDIDPMLLASLVRQESGFQADVVSGAGAVGLAQLMPFTARKWSRKLRIRYSRSRLVDARYSLRVGGAFLQSLIQELGSVEAALAAYNAGKIRVAQWLADRHYSEPAEFVESIPFSQTRHYVQVVLNGAVIYQQLYGSR
jgi:soluble lytic murein transglycosylase